MRADAKKNYDQLLAIARRVVTEEGADASLRDIARRAGVGLGTLYRHFPTREALLDALLRAGFDELTVRAGELETSNSAEDALISWLRETVAIARNYRGVTTSMMAAIEDADSALHGSCVTMRAAGARLLARAQARGGARTDIDGADLFALIAALAWLGDRPSQGPRAGHLFGVIADAIPTNRSSLTHTDSPGTRHRPAPRRYDLVIFDCDGVLVDSELITNRVFVQLLNEIGIPVTLKDMFEQFVGRSMDYCWDLAKRKLGKPLPDGVKEDYGRRTTAALEAELKAVHGIESTLDALDALRVRYCVASSGTHDKMRTTLGITGLLPRFQGRIYSVTEVAHAKPAPDVYLYAARRNGVAPAACCVIEDSPTGVAAGVAAGMTVYGYCGATPRERLTAAGAQHTFADMARLPELLFGP